MKKIVTSTLIVCLQLMVGALFLVGLFNSKAESEKLTVVENNNLSKMADVVNVMFVSDVKKETTKTEDKDNEEEKKDNNKEVALEEFKEEVVKKEIKEPEVVEKKEEPSKNYLEEEPTYNAIKTYTGSLTGYGPDCYGCSGHTASGYNVKNTSTYTDSQFGEVRIVAADRSIPFYSIVRINIPGDEPFNAIVLDTGGNVGFGKGTLFDLLFPTEKVAMGKKDNVKFEIIRNGNA